MSYLNKGDVLNIHREMAQEVSNAYNILPFSASKRFNNLCLAKIQFIFEENHELLIADVPFTFHSKNIITSSCTIENIYPQTANNLNILAWPFFKDGKLRSISNSENTKKDLSKTLLAQKLYDDTQDNRKCANSLALRLAHYEKILSNPSEKRNPYSYLRSNYGYTTLESMKHSEPLMIWKLETRLPHLKKKFLQSRNLPQDDNIIKKVIVHFYTKRQTCQRCESLIQKSSHKFDYVPLISFNEIFLRDAGNEKEDDFCDFHEKKSYYTPYSKLELELISLQNLTKPKKPISAKKFLAKTFPYALEENFNDFDNNLENKQNMFKYCSQIAEWDGIKRIPIQFYSNFP